MPTLERQHIHYDDSETISREFDNLVEWANLDRIKMDARFTNGHSAIFYGPNQTNGQLSTSYASIEHDGSNLRIRPDSGYVRLESSKTDTGDPTGAEGMLYYNTFDNAFKIYADGAWRTIVTW